MRYNDFIIICYWHGNVTQIIHIFAYHIKMCVVHKIMEILMKKENISKLAKRISYNRF